jgi:hypothetical protein
MRFKIKLQFSITLFLLVSNFTFAQISDFQTWGNVSLEKEFKFDLKVSIAEEVRFCRNMSEIDEFFTEIGAEYKFTKFLKSGLSYRFIRNYTNSGLKRFDHRFDGNIKFDFSIKRFSFDYRIQYQTDNEDLFTENLSTAFQHTLRNRFRVHYNVNNIKLNPYFSTEFFYKIDPADISKFNKMRNSLGFEYELSKRDALDLYIMVESELNKETPEQVVVAGLSYKYKFK